MTSNEAIYALKFEWNSAIEKSKGNLSNKGMAILLAKIETILNLVD